MLYDMGLQHLLYGVTFECPSVALQEKPILVRCVMEGKNYSSEEINTIFSASKASGKSLYYVEEELLQAIEPDIIFTQDACEVCQIDTKCTSATVTRLKKQPKIISLTPNNLEEVYNTALIIAKEAGVEETAYTYLHQLQQRTNLIIDRLRQHRMPIKPVLLLEWIQPIYNCGHWIPYQIAQAGGIDMLSNPGGDSIVTSWEKVLKYNPSVIVLSPCGFDTRRAVKELQLLTEKPGWDELAAVKTKQVYLADFDLFTQPSASTLVDGIELLAAIFHPQLFSTPSHLKHKTVSIQNAFTYEKA
jgi:iron complex transport system substrate-binding protein